MYRLFSLSGKDSAIEIYLSSTSDIFEGYLDYFHETSLFNFENLIPQPGRITYQYVKLYNLQKYLAR